MRPGTQVVLGRQSAGVRRRRRRLPHPAVERICSARERQLLRTHVASEKRGLRWDSIPHGGDAAQLVTRAPAQVQ